MIEESGDVFEYLDRKNYICITTNGNIKKNGEAVMGGGNALQARSRFPQLPKALAASLSTKGNNVALIDPVNLIVAFPVKTDWWKDADIELVERSSKQLKSFMEGLPKTVRVYLCRPGCGKGNLRWNDVKPVLERHFSGDDRLIVIDR